MSSPPEHYVFDDVIGAEELLWIYHELIYSSSWTLSWTSKQFKTETRGFMGFPGLLIQRAEDHRHGFFSGYFTGITHRIRHAAKLRRSLSLPQRIHRIHATGQSSLSKTEFHTDMDSDQFWTILGFLNPVWNAKDGGEFYLEDHKIDYKPGRFILFKSNTLHDGGFVVNESLNYWRITVSIILGSLDEPQSTPREQ